MQDKWLKMGIALSMAIDNFSFKVKESLRKENGDTNLISIIIVLGIVLALVVIFRGQIQSIVQKIQEQVNNFQSGV